MRPLLMGIVNVTPDSFSDGGQFCDSDAAIQTAGMLGSQYVGLQAGGSETFLGDGSEIEFTQSAIVLENLISKYLFNQGSDSEENESGE